VGQNHAVAPAPAASATVRLDIDTDLPVSMFNRVISTRPAKGRGGQYR
jgi:hypothetical protein